MTRISEKNITKKVPTMEDTIFGGNTDNFGSIVRYDIEALVNLIKQMGGITIVSPAEKSKSYFPSGW